MSDDLIKSLINGSKRVKNDKINYVKELYAVPKKDKGVEAPKIPIIAQNIWQQADLLVLPNDKGFDLCLVVVDASNRHVDAEPLLNKKSATVISALLKIYKRGIIKKPKLITVDGGKEFMGDFSTELAKIGISLNIAKVGRHRQNALVERKNQKIGKIVHQLITHEELETKHSSSAWVKNLPSIIKLINEDINNKNEKRIEPQFSPDPIYSTKDIELLDVGDKVRIPLDEPHDLTTKSKLHGKFRSGDIRWETKETTIKRVLLKPMTPVMYIVESQPNVGYTRNQLQLVKQNIKIPNYVQKDDANGRFTVKKILDKKFIKGMVYFLIHWNGYKKNESTWEKRSELIKDIPQLIKQFETKYLNAERKHGHI